MTKRPVDSEDDIKPASLFLLRKVHDGTKSPFGDDGRRKVVGSSGEGVQDLWMELQD